MTLQEDLTDLEKEILAKGEAVLQTIRTEALEIRKSKIVAELAQIEETLASFLAPKPAPTPTPAPAKKAAAKSDKGASDDKPAA